jgi:hypothetical protein
MKQTTGETYIMERNLTEGSIFKNIIYLCALQTTVIEKYAKS